MEIELKPYERLTIDKFIESVQRLEQQRYRYSYEPERPDTVVMHPQLAREFYIECFKLTISPLDEKTFDGGDYKYRQVSFCVMGCKITLYTSLDISNRKFILK